MASCKSITVLGIVALYCCLEGNVQGWKYLESISHSVQQNSQRTFERRVTRNNPESDERFHEVSTSETDESEGQFDETQIITTEEIEREETAGIQNFEEMWYPPEEIMELLRQQEAMENRERLSAAPPENPEMTEAQRNEQIILINDHEISNVYPNPQESTRTNGEFFENSFPDEQNYQRGSNQFVAINDSDSDERLRWTSTSETDASEGQFDEAREITTEGTEQAETSRCQQHEERWILADEILEILRKEEAMQISQSSNAAPLENPEMTEAQRNEQIILINDHEISNVYPNPQEITRTNGEFFESSVPDEQNYQRGSNQFVAINDSDSDERLRWTSTSETDASEGQFDEAREITTEGTERAGTSRGQQHEERWHLAEEIMELLRQQEAMENRERLNAAPLENPEMTEAQRNEQIILINDHEISNVYPNPQEITRTNGEFFESSVPDEQNYQRGSNQFVAINDSDSDERLRWTSTSETDASEGQFDEAQEITTEGTEQAETSRCQQHEERWILADEILEILRKEEAMQISQSSNAAPLENPEMTEAQRNEQIILINDHEISNVYPNPQEITRTNGEFFESSVPDEQNCQRGFNQFVAINDSDSDERFHGAPTSETGASEGQFDEAREITTEGIERAGRSGGQRDEKTWSRTNVTLKVLRKAEAMQMNQSSKPSELDEDKIAELRRQKRREQNRRAYEKRKLAASENPQWLIAQRKRQKKNSRRFRERRKEAISKDVDLAEAYRNYQGVYKKRYERRLKEVQRDNPQVAEMLRIRKAEYDRRYKMRQMETARADPEVALELRIKHLEKNKRDSRRRKEAWMMYPTMVNAKINM